MRSSPSAPASSPFAIAITSALSGSSLASRSPAQRTPNELTPLSTISAPANASDASSSWYALTDMGSSSSKSGWTLLVLMLSMISRSR
jgi:hypothetical protein